MGGIVELHGSINTINIIGDGIMEYSNKPCSFYINKDNLKELEEIKESNLLNVSKSFLVNLALARLFDEIEIFGLMPVLTGNCNGTIYPEVRT